MSVRLLITICAVLCLAGSAQAQLPLTISPADQAYTKQQEFTSPITGEKFNASVLSRNVGFGIRDFDGCPHPPINALAYALVIDPKTGYVAYPEEFARPARWTEAELAEALGKPRFARTTLDDLPWAGAYAWEKFENAAKLAEARQDSAARIGSWWLQAAWAVRLDQLPAQSDFSGELQRALRELPKGGRDPGDVLTPPALQLANSWARYIEDGGPRPPTPEVNIAAADSPAPPSIREDAAVGVEPPAITGTAPEVSTEALLAVAWAYRSRGELPAARRWLARALQQDSAVKSSPLFAYLDNSINLEREYLAKAQRWMRQAFESGELREHQLGQAAFYLGEVARRLGDNALALHWYNLAGGRSLGIVKPKLLERQKELVVSESPYG